jgi:hypothetical protein
MPRSASTGVYTAPSNSFNPAAPDTVISSTAWNATSADYVTALAHTASTTRALYPTAGQVQDGAFMWGGTAGGSSDVITLTLAPALTAYSTGQPIRFFALSTNTTATPTLNVNAVGAATIKRADGTAVQAGDLAAGGLIEVVYDGSGFRFAAVATSQATNVGGATVVSASASFALTSASTRVQAVTMTVASQSVQLPDATTVSKGGPLYVIGNEGSFPFGVRGGTATLITNGDFATDTVWTKGTSWTIASGVAVRTALGSASSISQTLATTANVRYSITFTVSTLTAGTITPLLTGGSADATGTAVSAPGTYTVELTSNGNTSIAFQGSSTFAGSIDNVVVRQINGALLAVIPPGDTATISCSDNSTAPGVWKIVGNDLTPAMVVADVTLSSTYTTAVTVQVALSSTLSLHFARNSSGSPFVFAVDHSTYPATVGTPVLIVASNLNVAHAFAINGTKAMVIVDGAASNIYNVSVAGAVCTVSAVATAGVFDLATFTGDPLICALGANSDLFVALDVTGTTVRAQAVDCSGTNPSAGSSVNVSALGTGTVQALGIYRVTASTALAIYQDDSGSAGTPFSIRAVVLSLSGTTITVNTSAGINDIIANASNGLPIAALSATRYHIGYASSAGTTSNVVSVGVSGTTVTFGTPLVVQTAASYISVDTASFSSNRFKPNLFALSSTSSLLCYSDGQPVRHVVLSDAVGVITAGNIIYSLFVSGGNFPQSSAGFLAYSAWTVGVPTENLFAVAISGTTLSIGGNFAAEGFAASIDSNHRFGLSGGVQGVGVGNTNITASLKKGLLLLFKFKAGQPQFLGRFTLPNLNFYDANRIPIELSSAKAAFTGLSLAQSAQSVAAVRLVIAEFAA